MKLNNETKIGMLVFVTLVVLGFITWKAGNFKIAVGGYEVKIQFTDIDGIGLNSPVTLNGMEIGRVKKIQFLSGDQPKVELTLWIQGDMKIKKTVIGRVKNLGFMGEKYVGLSSIEGPAEYLQPGSVITGQESASFEDLLTDGKVIAKNIKEISEEINERLRVNSQAIDDIVRNTDTTMKNLASISVNVNERLEVNKMLVDDSIKNFNSASQNLEEFSEDLKVNPWKLLYKPKTRKMVNAAK